MPDRLGLGETDPHDGGKEGGLRLGVYPGRVPYPTGRLLDGEPRAILFDSTACIGCRQCVEACKDWNVLPRGNPYAIAPGTWLVVDPPVPEGQSSVWGRLSCQHCESPMCAAVCPVEAITKYDEGPVVIDPNVCIGCTYCVYACPWHVIARDEIPGSSTFGKATKCTMCADRLADGGLEPLCVHICPTPALSFGTLAEISQRAVARSAETGGEIYGRREAGGTQVLHVLKASPADHGLPRITPERFPRHHIPLSVELQGLLRVTGGVSGKLRAVRNAFAKPWRLVYRYGGR